MILKTDSYKASHYRQYPGDTQHVYSYFESRGGEYPETVFFGLQYILQRHLAGEVVTLDDVHEAEDIIGAHFGDASMFNKGGWLRIVHEHGGQLPLHIKAVPEGTPVRNSNVLMTIVNTDPMLPWLTNYVETLLCQVWYPSTVATLSRENKRTIAKYLEETGTPEDIDYKLHDFGYRGSTSHESAGIGGCAHLVNFKGTDTMAALMVARRYYDMQMAGHSVPAAEHSTITSWGRENEGEAYRNMLEQYPTGIVAVVSDSYDIFNACENIWGNYLKDEVLSRNGVLVIRPDSLYPPKVVCEVLGILADKFGFATNGKGYDVINPKVRVLQGDGINNDMVEEILRQMRAKRWSADNIAFGSGGGLLQNMNRDTQQFAFKCSAMSGLSGQWFDVYKSPVGAAQKQSKRGRLKLILKDGEHQTVPIESSGADVMRDVFYNGEILGGDCLADIRERAAL